MVIGIDLDSTLNNLLEVWVTRYNQLWNDSLQTNDIDCWDLSQCVKPECGKKIYDILLEDGLFKNLGLRKHADVFVESLLRDSHDVYIITAYQPEVVNDKIDWVKKHLPFFPINNLMFVNNKQIVKLDVLIDDGIHNFSKDNHDKWIVVRLDHNKNWIKDNTEKIDFILDDWEDDGFALWKELFFVE